MSNTVFSGCRPTLPGTVPGIEPEPIPIYWSGFWFYKISLTGSGFYGSGSIRSGFGLTFIPSGGCRSGCIRIGCIGAGAMREMI